MSLDQLFVEGPQFSETTLLKMPPDPERWPEAILSQVKEQFPVIDSLAMTVKFTNIDEQAGTAIGSVAVVHPQLKKTAFIPIIVKDGMMFPLDVWQDEKKVVRPIGPDTFETYFFDERTFQALDKRPASHLGQYFDDPSMWTSTYPPLQGRYAYASVEGALLGEVLETASPKDLKRFEKAASDFGILAGYKRTGLLPMIEKVAAKAAKVEMSVKGSSQPVQASEMIDEILPLNVTIAVIRKDPKGFSLLTATDEQFIRAAHGLSYAKCKSWCDQMVKGGKLTGHGEDHMNDVCRNGEKVIVAKIKPQNNVLIQDDFKNDAVQANTFGAYKVRRMKDSVLELGLVVPKVVDFDQNVKSQKIFLGGSNSIMQDRIAGIPCPTDAELRAKLKELKRGMIQVGQLGTFVIFDGDSALATVPVQVVRQESLYGGSFRVADLSGNVFIVHHQGDSEPHQVKRITKCKGSGGRLDSYTVPSVMTWVPMQGFGPVASSPGQFMEKTAASQVRDMDPLRVTWTGLNYEVSGRNFDKIASGFDPRNMNEGDVQFVGLALGADKFSVKRLIKTAKTNGRAILHGLRPAQDWGMLLEKRAKYPQQLEQYCEWLKTDLVKEAAVLGDQGTVDTVLSLNFLNKDNIQKFVDALPVLVKAHQKIAEMVLASRIGASSIPHDAAVVCMNRMTAVINGLMALDQSLSPLSQKAQDKARAKSQEATKELGGV